MSPRTLYPTALTDLQQAVLLQVARYRMTVLDAAKRLPQLAGASSREVNAVFRDLKQQSLLASAALCHGKTYWYLTPDGAQEQALKAVRSGPLSEPAKIRSYAILHFCCLSGATRYQLTSAELAQHFRELLRPGMPAGYYFDSEGPGQLGLIRVDAGRRGRWDRVVESLRQDISRHFLQPEFGKLVAMGRFEITLLTVFPQKAKRIEHALAEHRDSSRVRVRVVAIPDLLPLVISAQQKEDAQPR